MAIQLSHAGRKASSRAPWEGGAQIRPDEPGGWKTLAPSPVPHSDGEDAPLALDRAGLRKVRDDFVAAARRAARSASTASKCTARTATCCTSSCRRWRTSARTNTAAAWRTACAFRWRCSTRCAPPFPADKPVWMRISATDWVPGGWDIEGTVALSQALKARGCAAIHVTTGGVSPAQAIKLGPGYQVPYAQRVKADVGLPTMAVGLITEPEQAEAIIAAGEADAVSLARAMLYDPRWPWHAAAKLGAPRRSRRSSTGARSRGSTRTCSRARSFGQR
jgi:2,4-dienoyl-CoA reductase-like NADH-dependent reductase (Old Yellow Enzyme family)